MCVYIYIYIHIICMYVCMCIYIYIYIHSIISLYLLLACGFPTTFASLNSRMCETFSSKLICIECYVSIVCLFLCSFGVLCFIICLSFRLIWGARPSYHRRRLLIWLSMGNRLISLLNIIISYNSHTDRPISFSRPIIL